MPRRRSKNQTPDLSAEWEKIDNIQVNGRHVVVGTELRIKGQRGRFQFIKYVKTPAGAEWIDVWGGPKGAEQLRSFRLEDIKTVHYKNTTDKHLAQTYKEKKASIEDTKE